MKNYDSTDSLAETSLNLLGLYEHFSQPLKPHASKHLNVFRKVEKGLRIGDTDCSGSIVNFLFDIEGNPVNAVFTLVTADGSTSHVYFPGGRHFGAFALFGKLEGLVVVTSDILTAGLIHLVDRCNTIAVNSAINFEKVCDDVALKYPDIKLVIALDKKDGIEPVDSEFHAAVLMIAADRKLKVAFSGNEATFANLAGPDYFAGYCAEQFAAAKVPPEGLGSFRPRLAGEASDVPTLRDPAVQNGSSIMYDLMATVHRSVIVSPEYATAIAVWILYSHCFQSFPISPFLLISSPTRSSGKSTLIALLSRLCHRPFDAGDLGDIGICAAVEGGGTTALFDDAQDELAKKSSPEKLLKKSYTRRVANWKTKDQVKTYSIFSPKAIALIGAAPDALSSLGIPVRLFCKRPSETVIPVPDAGPDELVILHGRILRWVEDNKSKFSGIMPARVGVENDRAEDNYRPLLAVATLLGGKWLQKTRVAFKKIAEAVQPLSNIEDQLISDIFRVFKDTAQNRMHTMDLVKHLCDNVDAPWSTFSGGRPITPIDLSKLLRGYGVGPKQLRIGTKGGLHGYELFQFNQVFQQYVKPEAM